MTGCWELPFTVIGGALVVCGLRARFKSPALIGLALFGVSVARMLGSGWI